MKISLALFLLFSFTACFSQFAVINDPEGFVNVRSDGNIKSKITDSLDNGKLIFCFEHLGNWISIEYIKNGKEFHGFIYKDRCTSIDSYKEISKTIQSENNLILLKDSLQIQVCAEKFIPQEHSIAHFKEYPDQIEFIDGKKYWGTDGGMPTSKYSKIEIQMSSEPLLLPFSALEGLYEPTLRNTQVNIDEETNTIYIQSMNSDGAGGYLIIWLIKNGEYIERFVVHGF